MRFDVPEQIERRADQNGPDNGNESGLLDGQFESGSFKNFSLASRSVLGCYRRLCTPALLLFVASLGTLCRESSFRLTTEIIARAPVSLADLAQPRDIPIKPFRTEMTLVTNDPTRPRLTVPLELHVRHQPPPPTEPHPGPAPELVDASSPKISEPEPEPQPEPELEPQPEPELSGAATDAAEVLPEPEPELQLEAELEPESAAFSTAKRIE